MENLRASIASHIRTASTPAEELRIILGELEGRVGKLGFGDSGEPVELLLALDRANALLEELAERGANLSGERGRFETVGQQFRRKGKRFLRSVGGRRELQALRAAQPRTPPAANWWWYIDELLDGEQRTRRSGTLRTIGITVAVLAIISALYIAFLMPDETTRMRYRHEQAAEQALMSDDPAAALISVEEGLTYAPDDEDLLLLRAVALVLLDEAEQAEIAFTEIRELVNDDEKFYSARAQAYMLGNRPELALEDAIRLIEADPTSGLGYFQAGNAYGSMGHFYEAAAAYEKAGELAGLAGEIELEGMARVQLANLMMIMMSPQMDMGDLTPTENEP